MAAFTVSQPQHVFDRKSDKPSLMRRLFNATVEARMARARVEVAEYVASTDSQTASLFDRNSSQLDDAVVGKKGVHAWPF